MTNPTLTESRASVLGGLAGRFSLQIIVVVGVVLLAIVEPSFRSAGNFQTVMTQASFAGLIACGMTLLIVGGMIDLSVAGILAVSAVTASSVLPYTTIGLAVLAALAVGTVFGVLNGIVVTKLKIPAFIATLGMLNIYLAIAFIWTQGRVQSIGSVHYRELGTGTLLGIPLPFVILIAVCLISYVLLQHTPFGRSLRAIGSSEAASRMAGIRVDRVIITAFAISGLFTAVAAVALSALLSSANGNMALGIELNAIAIAVVGGTSLRGGSGSLLGTFTAAFLFASLSSALNLIGVPSYWQSIAVGLVLVTALALGARRRSSSRTPAGGADVL